MINSLNSTKVGGWVLLHDMLPRNWVEQHVPIITNGPWTGDVWKVAFELANSEEIEFRIIRIDFGIGVIRKLSNQVNIKDFREDLNSKQYDYFYDNFDKLPVIDWDAAQGWLNDYVVESCSKSNAFPVKE